MPARTSGAREKSGGSEKGRGESEVGGVTGGTSALDRGPEGRSGRAVGIGATAGERGEQRQLVEVPEASRRAARRDRGPRITERDVEIVAWIARWRFASLEQVRARFGLGRSVAYERLGRLVELGLLDFQRLFTARPGSYTVTADGLGVAEVGLPRVGVDLRTYRHDAALVDVAIDLERRGLEVVSERELRAADAGAAEPRYAVVLGGQQADGRARRHYPDLIVGGEGQARFAVELELAAKRTARLREILVAYRRAQHLQAVVYYAELPAVRTRLETLRDELSMADRLDVRPWSEVGGDG